MRTITAFLGLGLVGVAALGTSGCGEVRSALGYEKRAPDEFAVVARPPLSVPPNFALRPPAPGEARPQQLNVTRNAENLVFGGTTQQQAAAGGDGRTVPLASPSLPVTRESVADARMRDLLRTSEAEPGIRQRVNQETAAFVYEREYLLDHLLFWREKPPAGIVLDPEAEKKRLQENQALGKPVTDGTTPIIERKRKGLFF